VRSGRDVAITDADFIARLRQRDPDAVTAVADDHARILYRAARGMGFQPADAEELVQEVFVTFMQTLDRFEGRSQVRTWLFGILHHKALERRRAMADDSRHDPIDAAFESQFDERGRWRTAPPSPVEAAMSREVTQALHECVATLPGLQREVFVLREMQELDTAEVCKILGCTVTYMGVLLHRARTRLRGCLQSRGWRSVS
jgi:RNA polymerase sigma-70 factor (ECF subfamily)